MIATVLKHYLYDMAIGVAFDAIGCNFTTPIHKYLGQYWLAVDDDGWVVAYGKCIEQNCNLIILADGELCGSRVRTDLFQMLRFSESEMRFIRKMVEEEEDDVGIDEYT